MYDSVVVEDGVDLPELENHPNQGWQTKDFEKSLNIYKINSDGRLLKEKYTMEYVEEEERPNYNEEIGGFENEWEKAFGMMQKESEGWEELDFHGIFSFYQSLQIKEPEKVEGDNINVVVREPEEWFCYEAKFTDGELMNVKRIETDR